MQSLSAALDKILDDQVESGSFESKEAVIQALFHLLIEKDIDKNINIGIEQENQGLGTEFNNQFAEKLMERVQIRISDSQTLE